MRRKTEQEKIDQFFNAAFTKMFDMVGLTYDTVFTNQPFWYTKHKWSREDDQAFTEWFVTEYRQQFKKKKAYALDEARWFLFNYGWSIDNDIQ